MARKPRARKSNLKRSGPTVRMPPSFGHIEGAPIGTKWEFRNDVYKSGVHRRKDAGIDGNTKDGAYCVVLKGDSEYSDEDHGETFTYMGSGGRAKGARPRFLLAGKHTARASHWQNWNRGQVRDQDFSNIGNRALQISAEKRNPVRVVRGVGKSRWAPNVGYRYDGLYMVSNPRREQGPNGLLVCKFDFTRREDQAPLPIDDVPTDHTDIAVRRRLHKEEKETSVEFSGDEGPEASNQPVLPIIDLPVADELAPVRDQLAALSVRGGGSHQKRARKPLLLAIGRRVRAVVADKAAHGEDAERWSLQLWTYVSSYIPGRKVYGPWKVEDVYNRFEREQGGGESIPDGDE